MKPAALKYYNGNPLTLLCSQTVEERSVYDFVCCLIIHMCYNEMVISIFLLFKYQVHLR